MKMNDLKFLFKLLEEHYNFCLKFPAKLFIPRSKTLYLKNEFYNKLSVL